MYLIWMTEQDNAQLPFLPSVENLEALSSFITGRSSRSNSTEQELPRLRSQDTSFPRSVEDILAHFEDHDDQLHKQQKLSPSAMAKGGAAQPPPAAAQAAQSSVEPDSDPNSESLACICCQKRKTRCDHGQPCSMCVSLSQECVYTKPKKRGPKPGSMMRIKEQSHHLKHALKVVLQMLINVNSDFEELGPSVSELLQDSHVFDAVSCQIVIKGLSDCLNRSRQPKQESRSQSKTKAKGGVAK